MSHPGGCSCADCRRRATLAVVAAAEPSLSADVVQAAFDTAVTTRAALRAVEAALADGGPAGVEQLVEDRMRIRARTVV